MNCITYENELCQLHELGIGVYPVEPPDENTTQPTPVFSFVSSITEESAMLYPG